MNFTTSAIIAGESFYRSSSFLSFGAIVLLMYQRKGPVLPEVLGN
jgi:hypothetical protein